MLHPKVHSYYLNIIKEMLKASFVGWVEDRKGKYLKIIVNKNVMALPFEGGDVIGEESYKKLINDIIKAFGYERGEIQEPVQLHEQEWGTEEVDAKNDGGVGDR